MLTSFQLLRDSLRHHRRMHAAVALGVAVTTAVLVGALVVGDSVRGSLKDTALDRLGGIDEVLVTDKFFAADLPQTLSKEHLATAAVVLQGSITNPDTKLRASQVTLIGSDKNTLYLDRLLNFPEMTVERYERYLSRIDRGPPAPQPDDVVYLNQPLADELGAKVGDEIIVRLPASREVPAESALGRKTDASSSTPRLKVAAVLPAEGFAAFSLNPNQQASKNAYLSIATLQKVLDKPERANAILVQYFGPPRNSNDLSVLQQTHDRLTADLHPTITDYGLKWTQARPGYFSLTSERMLFEPNYEAAALAAYKDLQPQRVFTYLANTIAARVGDAEKEIPYSTVAALDIVDQPTLGPFVTPDGKKIEKIGDDEILLTKWAADDLGVQPGAEITITYFEPESTHSDVGEATATLKLAAIVDLKDKDDPLLSPELTPELKGVTDQLTIKEWNPPFPYDADRIRDQDEKYWDDHRATPKAFVSAATGRRLWSSRFGDMTSLRVAPREGLSIEKLNAMFRPDPASLGFAFQPVKLQALKAATGTTPFEGLFIGFSFFIIAAAVMLTVLLFRLGVEQRADEAGLLLAVGLTPRRVGRFFLTEGAVVAAVGAALGVAVGVGYAWLMLYLLRTLWFDAVRTTSLYLHVVPTTIVTGYVAGLLVSIAAIAWSLRMLRRVSVRRLLANQAAESDLVGATGGSSASANGGKTLAGKPPVAPVSFFLLALGIGAFATQLTDMAQAGAFFGSAALVLTALILLLRRTLAAARFGSLVSQGSGRIATLAVRNAGRNPGRSTLTIALVASAAFLIVSVSAFRLAPPSTYLNKSSGTGGFALLGRSDLSILPNLNDADGQIDLNFSQAQRKQLAGVQTYSLRYKPGDDSSCLNLYQTTRPQVVGVSDALIDRGGFNFAAVDDKLIESDEDRANPWRLLNYWEADRVIVPIILDQATAQYGLHLGGVGTEFDLDVGEGRPALRCRIVGLLANSILQGMVITSEAQFKTHFPDVSGYRMFLVEAQPEQVEPVRRMLEDVLSDFGFDAQSTQTILADYLSVQNTYLSTFQTLGGLGLLLGTLGLAVVQLRNVLERRGELALLRAVGLSRSLLARLVLLENLALLAAGLLCGTLAALVAVLPHAFGHGAGIPWTWLAATLAAVLAAGLLAGIAAVRAVLRMPLLTSLREG